MASTGLNYRGVGAMGEPKGAEETRSYCVEDLSFLLVEYDRVSDTLHIIFSKNDPDESVLVGEDVIVNLREGKIVSITLPEASKKLGLESCA